MDSKALLLAAVPETEAGGTYLFTLYATSGALNTMHVHCRPNRNSSVRNACRACSGSVNELSRLQRSIGLM